MSHYFLQAKETSQIIWVQGTKQYMKKITIYYSLKDQVFENKQGKCLHPFIVLVSKNLTVIQIISQNQFEASGLLMSSLALLLLYNTLTYWCGWNDPEPLPTPATAIARVEMELSHTLPMFFQLPRSVCLIFPHHVGKICSIYIFRQLDSGMSSTTEAASVLCANPNPPPGVGNLFYTKVNHACSSL